MSIIPEGHKDAEDDGSYFEMRITFYKTDEHTDEQPAFDTGHIETHIHGAPPQQIVESLLYTARDLVIESMGREMFSDSIPDVVRGVAARIMATQYIQSRVNDPEFAAFEAMSAKVPDDISSLLETPEG